MLWIDEIEMGVGGYREGQDPSMSRIFSGFLTWMQEKSALVFVAATANRIHLLPAEILRKGRFDQVFFVDLPNEEERKQIFSIHLKRNRCDVGQFDLVFLAKATKGWNGAEIEQAVVSAVVDSYAEGRPLTEEDLHRMISSTVPLSVTMDEQIKAIRSWAHDRALNASQAKLSGVRVSVRSRVDQSSGAGLRNPSLPRDDIARRLCQFLPGSICSLRYGARSRIRPLQSRSRAARASHRAGRASVSRRACSSAGS